MFARLHIYSLISIYLINIFYCFITIRRPRKLRDLFEDNKIKTSYATFGFNPYGYIISGHLYYAGNNIAADLACNYNDLKTALDNETKTIKDHSIPQIIMVDRGSCHFVEKVRNIQHAGGKAAIIIDNNDEDIDTIIMGDDGTGKNIFIPAVLISKTDGSKLKNYYLNNLTTDNDSHKTISIDIDFQIEHKDNMARLDIFMSSSSEIIYKLFIDMYQYGYIKELVPHYTTFRSINFDDSIKPENRTEVTNCLGGGKYCAFQFVSDYSEKDLQEVKTNLFSKCLYITSKNHDDLQDYYKFLSNFYNMCLTNKRDDIFACARNIISNKSLLKNIDQCVADSFINSSNSKDLNLLDNKLFDEDYKLALDLNVKTFPEIYINRQAFWGELTATNLLEAICAGINKKPLICYTEVVFKKSSGVVSTWLIVLTVIAIVLGISIILFIMCRRFMSFSVDKSIINSQLDLKVNTVVTSYLALKDKN